MSSPLQFEIVPVTPFAQNCSVLWCTETRLAAIVDPGGEIEKIKAVLDKHDLEADKILITHGHADHAGGTAELARALDIAIIGPHKDDKFWIDTLPEQAARFGTSAETFVPDQWLNHGDQVTLGKLTFDVIHCPGHTPGHVVFYNKQTDFAVVGDVIFQGSIGRTDFPKGNHQDLIDSIRDRLFPLGDAIDFIPGHGPMSTFGNERQTNPFVADRNFG